MKTKTFKNSRTTAVKSAVQRAPRKLLALSYIPIAHHVYYDGSSFRTRVAIDGKTNSWNTSDKKKALEYRDYLLAARSLG